jgi:hypothetical protein
MPCGCGAAPPHVSSPSFLTVRYNHKEFVKSFVCFLTECPAIGRIVYK